MADDQLQMDPTGRHFFAFAVLSQELGDGKAHRPQRRIAHMMCLGGAATLRLLDKGRVVDYLQLQDVSLAFDAAVPCSLVLTCRAPARSDADIDGDTSQHGRRILLDFQNAEEAATFRLACSMLSCGEFEPSLFNTTTYMYGVVHKRCLSGFSPRHAMLLAGRLLLFQHDQALYPRQVLSVKAPPQWLSMAAGTVVLPGAAGEQVILKLGGSPMEMSAWLSALTYAAQESPLVVGSTLQPSSSTQQPSPNDRQRGVVPEGPRHSQGQPGSRTVMDMQDLMQAQELLHQAHVQLDGLYQTVSGPLGTLVADVQTGKKRTRLTRTTPPPLVDQEMPHPTWRPTQWAGGEGSQQHWRESHARWQPIHTSHSHSQVPSDQSPMRAQSQSHMATRAVSAARPTSAQAVRHQPMLPPACQPADSVDCRQLAGHTHFPDDVQHEAWMPTAFARPHAPSVPPPRASSYRSMARQSVVRGVQSLQPYPTDDSLQRHPPPYAEPSFDAMWHGESWLDGLGPNQSLGLGFGSVQAASYTDPEAANDRREVHLTRRASASIVEAAQAARNGAESAVQTMLSALSEGGAGRSADGGQDSAIPPIPRSGLSSGHAKASRAAAQHDIAMSVRQHEAQSVALPPRSDARRSSGGAAAQTARSIQSLLRNLGNGAMTPNDVLRALSVMGPQATWAS